MGFKKENFVTDKVREIRWYYIICPNCGWDNSTEDIVHYCPECGDSLLADRATETNGVISPNSILSSMLLIEEDYIYV